MASGGCAIASTILCPITPAATPVLASAHRASARNRRSVWRRLHCLRRTQRSGSQPSRPLSALLQDARRDESDRARHSSSYPDPQRAPTSSIKRGASGASFASGGLLSASDVDVLGLGQEQQPDDKTHG